MEFKERTAAVQVQEYLEFLIHFKKVKDLPSQREISEKLQVSRNAVKHALDGLKNEGQILVKERAGIISNNKIDINMLGMESMTTEFKNKTVSIKHLATTIETMPKRLDEFFNSNEPVIKIERVRFVKDIALTYEITYFSQKNFSRMEKIDFTNKSLYEVLEKEYHVKPTYGKESISCFLADKKISSLLKVKKGTPLYQVNSFNYQDDDLPIESTTQYLVGNKFKYHFNANNIYDYQEE